jgi:hypothetical protein
MKTAYFLLVLCACLLLARNSIAAEIAGTDNVGVIKQNDNETNIKPEDNASTVSPNCPGSGIADAQRYFNDRNNWPSNTVWIYKTEPGIKTSETGNSSSTYFLMLLAALIGAAAGGIVTWIIQNKLVRNQIKIESWRSISKELKEYRSYLARKINDDFIRYFQTINFKQMSGYTQDDITKLYTRCKEYLENLNPCDEWIYLFEQYEIVFPAVIECSIVMTHRYVNIKNKTDKIKSELDNITLAQANYEKIFSILAEVQELNALLRNEARLTNDLAVIVQNDCLGHLTSNKATMQIINDKTASRFAKDRAKKWHFAVNAAEAAEIETSQTWAPKEETERAI